MSILSRVEIANEIAQFLPDNTTREINEQDVRDRLINQNDSAFHVIDGLGYGEYNAVTTYNPDDYVTSGNIIYKKINASESGVAPPNVASWEVIGSHIFASETQVGLTKIASEAEVNAGTNAVNYVTPLRLSQYVAQEIANIDLQELEDLRTLTGTPLGNTNLGTFTGDTIPDNSTIKQAFQSLETGLEEAGFTGTTGSVAYVGGDGKLTEDNNNFFFDNTNKNLGIGTNTITSKLTLRQTTGTDNYINGLNVFGTQQFFINDEGLSGLGLNANSLGNIALTLGNSVGRIQFGNGTPLGNLTVQSAGMTFQQNSGEFRFSDGTIGVGTETEFELVVTGTTETILKTPTTAVRNLVLQSKSGLSNHGVGIDADYLYIKTNTSPLTVNSDEFRLYSKDYRSLAGFASPFALTEDGYEIDFRAGAQDVFKFVNETNIDTADVQLVAGLGAFEEEFTTSNSVNASTLTFDVALMPVAAGDPIVFENKATIGGVDPNTSVNAWIAANISGDRFSDDAFFIRPIYNFRAGDENKDGIILLRYNYI